MEKHEVTCYANGITKEFNTMDEAIEYQEYLVFVLGLDAEIL